MKNPTWLLPMILLSVACGPAFRWEGEYDPGDIEFEHAIAGRETGTLEDGTTVEILSIVLSNDANLCAAVAGTEGGQPGELDDVFALQVLGIRAGEFTSFDTNVGIFKALLGTEDGDALVAVNLIERVGGESIVDVGTNNLVDGEVVSESQMNISSQSLSNGELRRISGSFRADITMDRTDPETFDVDIDNDGESDYRRINATVRGRFSGAQGCSALGG